MPNILHPARTPELTLATAALIQMKPKTLQMLNVVDSKTHTNKYYTVSLM